MVLIDRKFKIQYFNFFPLHILVGRINYHHHHMYIYIYIYIYDKLSLEVGEEGIEPLFSLKRRPFNGTKLQGS